MFFIVKFVNDIFSRGEEKTMKKSLVILLCVVMVLGLVACGDSDISVPFSSEEVFPRPVLTHESMPTEEAMITNSDTTQKTTFDKIVREVEDYYNEINPVVLSTMARIELSSRVESPIVIVFVVERDYDNDQMVALREALLEAVQCIDKEVYVGLVSYDENVRIDLAIREFDAMQKAFFCDAIEGFNADRSSSAVNDAIIVGAKLLLDAGVEIPNAQLFLFAITDARIGGGCCDEDDTAWVLGSLLKAINAVTVIYGDGGNPGLLNHLKHLSARNVAQRIVYYYEADMDTIADTVSQTLKTIIG